MKTNPKSSGVQNWKKKLTRLTLKWPFTSLTFVTLLVDLAAMNAYAFLTVCVKPLPVLYGCLAFIAFLRRLMLAIAANFHIFIRSSNRLQNSPYFCVFEYTRVVKQKVWNEAENREQDLGRDAKSFSLASHALQACEARALRARKTLTARFTDFFTDFEKKTDCFAVYSSKYESFHTFPVYSLFFIQ